jgi:hypothetical protein
MPRGDGDGSGVGLIRDDRGHERAHGSEVSSTGLQWGDVVAVEQPLHDGTAEQHPNMTQHQGNDTWKPRQRHTSQLITHSSSNHSSTTAHQHQHHYQYQHQHYTHTTAHHTTARHATSRRLVRSASSCGCAFARPVCCSHRTEPTAAAAARARLPPPCSAFRRATLL